MRILLVALITVIAGVAVVGAYFFPSPPQIPSGSTVGSTFGSAKVSEIIMAPISSAATSSSLLNTDGFTRVVDTGFVSCATSSQSVYGAAPQATGVASWTWQMATTTVANQGLQGNTNYAMNLVVATSTTDNSYVSSSTQSVLNVSRYWPSGTYLTITTNATSSQTQLQCQAGVYYHGS